MFLICPSGTIHSVSVLQEFFVVSTTIASPTIEFAIFPLCVYVNASDRVQVVRLTECPRAELERVVFPGQRLMFEAPADAVLEVYAGNDEPELQERVACGDLACA